jgi:predicted enzyme related to lactoylglutathione lyase
MPSILHTVLTRLEVADLDSALPAYVALAAPASDVQRLDFPEFRMAIVGPFMLLEGSDAQLAPFRRVATLIAADHLAAVAALVDGGGVIVDGTTESHGGTRTIADDRDGNRFEVYTPVG